MQTSAPLSTTVKGMGRQATDWEKIFAEHISGQEHFPKIHKECFDSTSSYNMKVKACILPSLIPSQGFLGSSDSKESACSTGNPPWIREIPWRRKWQPTPVFLPGKSHGWRSPADYSPWGHKESDATEQLHFLPTPSQTHFLYSWRSKFFMSFSFSLKNFL